MIEYVLCGISLFLCGVIFEMYFGNHKDIDTMVENAVLIYKYDLLFDKLKEYEKQLKECEKEDKK